MYPNSYFCCCKFFAAVPMVLIFVAGLRTSGPNSRSVKFHLIPFFEPYAYIRTQR